MSKILKSVTVCIRITAPGQSNWTFPINIPFAVDEIIVKQVSYQSGDAAEADEVITVESDLIGGNILCSFIKGTSQALDLRYRTYNASVSGLSNFLTKLAGDVPYELSGTLMLHLEFVQYAHEK